MASPGKDGFINSFLSPVKQHQPTILGDGPLGALMLIRYPWHAVPEALLHMGLDRFSLRRTPGLSFRRLLGSSRGLAAGPWEPQRYGLFTVWDDAAALDAFEANSRIMRHYRLVAEEVWTVRLAPVRWHGAWGGGNPFARALPATEVEEGPWAILTRAAIRPRFIRTFLQASTPVTAQLGRQRGLIASVGLGELPLLFQATFSLWHDLPSAQAFAYEHPLHKAVIQRTRNEGWYREDLFARFRPTASYGTWDGRDPLAGLIKE